MKRSCGILLHHVVLLVVVTAVASLWCPSPAPGGTIYKFVDADGVIHFTNMPNRAQYRSVRLNAFPLWKAKSRFDSAACELWIRVAAKKYGLDAKLIKAIIKAESGFNPTAVSPKGARGLMQLMPQTIRHLGLSNPFDPRQNIMGGARYLKELLGRFDHNLLLALAAFNAGPETVKRHGGIPPYEETRTYIRRVLTFYIQSL